MTEVSGAIVEPDDLLADPLAFDRQDIASVSTGGRFDNPTEFQKRCGQGFDILACVEQVEEYAELIDVSLEVVPS